eukprot:TRINITY_DN173_c0_g1_i2.p1 TRINITY_DN173_c0_g1~~TRINITY_DN173_c0_g1_i2.p1  ORF type:complete len:1079 (-),score=426.17 TRINITY_DN173_c0_g1_i2:84-2993(-)
MIILRFEIQDISVEDMNAKEGLLLWCQKKTAGYRDVNVRDFTRSWQDGLAFNALIHKHRPDLLSFDDLKKAEAEKNLELAFSIAEKELDIPRFLDVEDMPVADERAIMTYLLQFFHLFSANRKAEVAGRRIAKLLNQNMTAEELRDNYEKQAKDLLEWMAKKQPEMDDKNLPNDLDGLRNEMKKFNEYQNGEKPPRAAEKLGIEGLYSNLQVKLKNSARPEYKAPEGLSPEEIDAKWNNLMKSEAEKEKLLQEELARLEKLNDLLRRFREKLAKLNEFYEDKNKYLEKRPEITSLDSAISEVKLIEGHKQNFENSKSRVADLKKLGDEIIALKYNEPEKIKADTGKIDHNWADLADKGDKKEAWARAEKEKQEQIEKLRLALADKTTELMRWYKDNIESLDDASFPDGLEEVLGFKDNVDKRETDLKGTAETKNAEVADLWKQLADLGVTDNKYTDYNMEDVNKAHGNLGNAIEKYKEAYAAEVKRQEEMEAKRKEFAEAAQNLVKEVDKTQAALEAVKDGEPEERSKKVAELYEKAPIADLLKACDALDAQQRELGISDNKHAPVTCSGAHSKADKLNKFAKNLLATLEQERIVKQRKAERQAETEKKEKIEALRSEFHVKSAQLDAWIDSASEELSSAPQIDLPADVTAAKEKLAEIRKQREQHTPEFTAVIKLAEELEKLQIPDVSSEKCAASWSGIYKQLEERAKHLSEEEPKQLARDKLRHAFADKAKELRTLIEQERAKLESLSGELDAQLKQTEEQNARLSQSLPKEIKELTDLNNQLVAAEVRSNPYTDLTIRAATSLAEQFKELVEERAKLLQGQINEKKGSTVSNEEISEFREIFQQFAKGGTGLKWFEFKAVLSALGEDVDDEQAKKTLDSYDKDGNGFLEFNEFMDYMMKRRSDNDTEDEILEAFREIAGGRDFITEAELAPLVTPQQLAYVKKTMPPKEGVANAFDFAAFTKKSFH